MAEALKRSPGAPPTGAMSVAMRDVGEDFARQSKQRDVAGIRSQPAFDPKTFLESIGDGRSIQQRPKREIIYTQGDHADAVFYIQQGKVKLTAVSEHGKEAIVAILGVDAFFGEECLTGKTHRTTTVTTMTDCAITRLEQVSIARTIHEETAFSEIFIAHLLDRAMRAQDNLADQLFNSSEKRLARLLLLLANFGEESEPEPRIGNISQESLAAMIGTTRSRVSFFMNKFRTLGLIEYGHNGGIEVRKSLLNLVLHEEPHIAR